MHHITLTSTLVDRPTNLSTHSAVGSRTRARGASRDRTALLYDDVAKLIARVSSQLAGAAMVALAGCAGALEGAAGPDAGEKVPVDGEGGDDNVFVIKTASGLHRVHYEVLDGHAFMEGDIDLGPVEEIRNRVLGDYHFDTTRLWPDGVVWYCLNDDLSRTNRRNIRAAMTTLSARTPLTFVDNGCRLAPSIEFDEDSPSTAHPSGTGSSNSIGMSPGTPIGFPGPSQSIDAYGSEVTESTFVHEILHAVGFWHEQSRSDRDQFVDIGWTCMTDTSQFEWKEDGRPLGPYDFDSIMHYETGKFGKNPIPNECKVTSDVDGNGTAETWNATIVRKNGSYIKGHDAMSRDDINMVWDRYRVAGVGAQPGSGFGGAIAIGDFDKDGYGDAAIGAPLTDVSGVADVGSVQVYRGTGAGLVPWKAITPATVSWSNEAGGLFGFSLAAKDIDQDGKDDLVIGSPHKDFGGVADSGGVAVLRGDARGLLPWRTYRQTSHPAGVEAAHERFGWSVAAGKLAGPTGELTLIVGAPGDGGNGAVYLFRGVVSFASGFANRIPCPSTTSTAKFGTAVAVTSIDSGTNDDLVVGAPGYVGNGGVFLYTGRTPDIFEGTTSPMFTYSHSILAPEARTRTFGASLASGYLFDPGRLEIAVGAPASNGTNGAIGAGAVYILGGSVPGFYGVVQTITQGAQEAGDRFGTSVAIGHIENTDYYSQLVVGAPGEDSDAGAISVFMTDDGTNGSLRLWQFFQNDDLPGGYAVSGDKFGSALAIGNINGIGQTDVSSDNWNNAGYHNKDVVVGHPGEHAISTFLGQNGWDGFGTAPRPGQTIGG
ncbi:M12 family metallopeptidase [Sorangium sp. So ce134]